MSKNPVRAAVLVSGGGTNLQALIDEEKRMKEAGEDCPYTIALVISSTKNAYALERAQNVGIKTEIASPYAVMGKDAALAATREEKNEAVSNRILELCRENSISFIVYAGYLTVLQGAVIKEYANRMINLHPALLPKFGGVGMWGHNVHEAVLAAGEKESGCTVHLVNEVCDGGEILIQKKVPVLSGDTPDTLYARIAPHEHEAMIEGVKLLAERLAD